MKKQLLLLLLLTSGFLSIGQNFQWINYSTNYRSSDSKILLDGYGNIYQNTHISGYNVWYPITNQYIYHRSAISITRQTVSCKILWNIIFPGITHSMDFDKKGNIYLTGSFLGKSDFDPGSGINILNSEGGEDVFILK